jgi:hypothetical protein
MNNLEVNHSLPAAKALDSAEVIAMLFLSPVGSSLANGSDEIFQTACCHSLLSQDTMPGLQSSA